MSGRVCLRVVLCIVLLMMTGSAATAAAQSRSGKTLDAIRLGGHVSLGFGGEVETGKPLGAAERQDLELAYGLDALVDLPVHKHITLGAQLRFSSFVADAWAEKGFDRSTLLDLTFTPKARYPFLRGSTLIEIYAAFPLGLTSASLSDDLSPPGLMLDGGLGFTVGALAGANVFLTDAVALTFELGYVRHAFGAEVTSRSSPGRDELDMSLGQVRLNAGLLVALR